MENNPPPDKQSSSSDPPDQPGDLSLDDDSHRRLALLSPDVDLFISTISSVPNKAQSPAPRVPPSAERFFLTLEPLFERSEDSGSLDSDSVLVDSIGRLGNLTFLLSQFPSPSPWLSRTSVFIQKAMMSMEDELRNILDEFTTCAGASPTTTTTTSSSSSSADINASKHFSSFHSHLHRRQDSDSGGSHHYHRRSSSSSSVDPDPSFGGSSSVHHYPTEDDDFPAIPYETVTQVRSIASAMVGAGYDTECCQVYGLLRRNAFKSAMKRRGFRKLSIEEIGKMSWEQLESQIATWNRVVRHTARVLYPREYKLCNEVFLHNPQIRDGIMTNLARAVVILFLNFAEAIAMTKRAADRLFKVLEIYESLTELQSAMGRSSLSEEAGEELQAEILAVQRRLGEAVVSVFSDLKDSIRNDPAKNSVSGGAVHPLTRYTMTYLKNACDYKESLESIFQKASEGGNNNKMRSPLAAELVRVMGMLDVNLEGKSKQYKDASLRCVFLMNNGRYILQKIKDSSEMHELVGRVASRKRSAELRGHHKNYQRETWGKVLQCLTHEGLQLNGKVHKPILKDRFKSFNQILDDIQKTQGTWVVSDEQLKSELRVSISSVMIPAYRSFVARFGQYFTPGRQTEKYIKYQPEDIEAAVEGLFEGNPNSAGKTKK